MYVHIRLCTVVAPLAAVDAVEIAVMLPGMHVKRVVVAPEVQPAEPLQYPRLSQHSSIHLPLLGELLRLYEIRQFSVCEVARNQYERWG